MNKLTLVSLALIGMVGTASADGTDGHCPRPYRPPHRVTPPKRPNPPPKPVTPPPCTCKGERGDQGPPGPPGEPGKVTVVTNVVEVPAPHTTRLGLGLMGTVQAPHGDWAWGPALQVSTDLSDRNELALSVGIAQPFIGDRESGLMGELKVIRHLDANVGVFGGIHLADIDGSDHNGHIDGTYLGLTAGLNLDYGRIRFAIGPTIGGLRDDFESGNQLAVGGQTSLFVRL